MVKLTE